MIVISPLTVKVPLLVKFKPTSSSWKDADCGLDRSMSKEPVLPETVIGGLLVETVVVKSNVEADAAREIKRVAKASLNIGLS